MCKIRSFRNYYTQDKSTSSVMKILSWNINGIRASKINLKKLFDSLDADIICLQETKVTRDMLDEPTAIVEGYNSYFSFSRKRSGYSGVANFCKDSVTPYKAEEGLSGCLTLKEEGSLGYYGNLTSFSDDELQSLDAEGRTIITQHKIKTENGKIEDLAIINVYCPRADPEREDRHLYKLRFFALLQTRAEALLKNGRPGNYSSHIGNSKEPATTEHQPRMDSNKSHYPRGLGKGHVIVLGDINTTHKLIDHCDPNHEEFIKKPSRIWLNQFLWEKDRDPDIDPVTDQEEFAAVTPYTKGGLFVDTLRYLHPDQEGAYTNWCTLTGARATNYGRRLDYIFGNVDLVESHLTGASVMPDVEGSDHCPVKAELKCESVPSKTCPPLCTKLMPEFLGKQQKLSMFFTKLRKEETIENASSNLSVSVTSAVHDVENVNKLKTSVSQTVSKRPAENTKITGTLKKRKTDSKKSETGAKQSSLKSFFNTNSKEQKKVDAFTVEANPPPKPINTVNNAFSSYFNKGAIDVDSQNSMKDSHMPDDKTATSDNVKPVHTEVNTSSNNKTVSAWKNLLGGLGPPPLCKGHKEPCVLRMVKKEGPNKGKQFYTCARGEGLKTNPEARCDFFKWIEKKKS